MSNATNTDFIYHDGLVWHAVPSMPGYYVSRCGRVVSTRNNRFRVLKLTPNSRGYVRLKLYCDTGRIHRTVHSLVMETFVGPRPVGQVIRHLDGDRANNTISNLAYGTDQDNHTDAVAHGTKGSGELSGRAKLTADQVREIIQRRNEPSTALAEQMGISPETVRKIRSGITWTHITDAIVATT